MTALTATVPFKVVLGRVRFDDGRPSQGFVDLFAPDPFSPGRMIAPGLGVQAAGSPPWLKGRGLPGLPFGEAVAQTLPPDVLASVLEGNGRVFSDLEVADLTRPVLDRVARGLMVLAGVPTPPMADPAYVPFSPVMLPHWHFIAGDDRAEPIVLGAMEYIALRVFTPEEFAYVQRCGGKLRTRASEAAPIEQTSDADEQRAVEWMRQNVRTYVAKQRDDRVRDCMTATGVRKQAALAGWNALPEPIKGKSRLSK